MTEEVLLMKIKPVISSAKPKYPDKCEIEVNKALLYYQPKRWLKEPLIGLTLAALLATGLAGCRDLRTEIDIGTTGGPAPILDSVAYCLSDEEALGLIESLLENDSSIEYFGYPLVTDISKNEDNFKFDAHIKYLRRKINLEYVSEEDVVNKKYPNLKIYSSESYNAQDVAEELKDIYNDAAIFYAEEHIFPVDMLYLQLRDFFEWLRSVGMEV